MEVGGGSSRGQESCDSIWALVNWLPSNPRPGRAQDPSSLSPSLCNEGPRSYCLGTRKLSGSHVSRRKERAWDGEEDTSICNSDWPLVTELLQIVFLGHLTPYLWCGCDSQTQIANKGQDSWVPILSSASTVGPPAPYASILGCSKDTHTHILCPLGFGPEVLGRGRKGDPERNVLTGPHTCRRGLGGVVETDGSASTQPCLGL